MTRAGTIPCCWAGFKTAPGHPPLGYIPMVNFLTDHANPTRYNIFLTSPPVNSPDQIQDGMRTLQETRVALGLNRAVPVAQDDPIAPFVRDHFRVVWTKGAYTLRRRVPP